MKLAKAIKLKFKCHISFVDHKTTEEYLVFSIVLLSEGENALVDLLEDLSKQQLKRVYHSPRITTYKVFQQRLKLKVFIDDMVS